MARWIILMMMSFWMAACAARDEHYYTMHPKALQEAIKKCPEQASGQLSCKHLQKIALRTNNLALQLRSDPQGYGKQILSLQETIAEQEMALQQNKNQPQLQKELESNKYQLKERLAVVKWLESPEG
ncbi:MULTISPECIES: hypothetical protein [Legionella]|uniref:hypothetical protein n=1 Tax=Legionella TaxID=445 RepID=UPI000F8CE5D5|nr:MULTISPECIES: hypothetical protein [Legionella]MCP0913648.1 hypothetical protein [Legionella sp. 27cVA30]RUQ96326.1 hypothetical protein ELY11_08070 [Legionella septentrionalis]